LKFRYLLRGPSPKSGLEEIRQNYAYLRVPLENDAIDRDRILLGFHMFPVLASGTFACIVFIVGAITILVANPDVFFFVWTSYLWPGNHFLLAFAASMDLTVLGTVCPIVSVSSFGTLVWLPWIIYCVALEMRRRDHAFPKGQRLLFLTVIPQWGVI
jgi:hypothetical protein